MFRNRLPPASGSAPVGGAADVTRSGTPPPLHPRLTTHQRHTKWNWNFLAEENYAYLILCSRWGVVGVFEEVIVRQVDWKLGERGLNMFWTLIVAALMATGKSVCCFFQTGWALFRENYVDKNSSYTCSFSFSLVAGCTEFPIKCSNNRLSGDLVETNNNLLECFHLALYLCSATFQRELLKHGAIKYFTIREGTCASTARNTNVNIL